MFRHFLCARESLDPQRLLVALHRRADMHGQPPPAAVMGDWLGLDVVIAPSVDITDSSPQEFMNLRLWDADPRATSGMRVGGGWFGCLRYPRSVDAQPVAYQGWTDEVIVLDEYGWWYESLRLSEVPKHISSQLGQAMTSTAVTPWEVRWTAPDRDHHQRSVNACLEAITAGEIYQACVVTHFLGRLSGHPVDLFSDVAAATQPAKAAYLSGGWGAIASFSPELFLRREGCTVESRPIKGTIPRHLDPELLLRSDKDVAENVMIVDLVRNDLGKVADTGTVRVSELLRVVEAPAVWHLVSTVRASIDPAVTNAALIAAAFPPASVTGTPKRRAQQLTAAWEPHKRGIYCGAVGICSPIAGLDLNVAIRTVEISGAGACSLGVGGGITSDSRPAGEWDECMVKASSIVDRTTTGGRTQAAS
nr:aminodeoxychorismate synthase component I [Mycobacterium dioxanotrophicus]